MKGIESIGETPVTEIVGREIVVTYDVYGKEANGTIKFKYTNDLYTKLTAAEATANLTVKQNLKKAAGSMKNAGLNTLLGMGTVFSVLILISLIISSFNLFKKKDKPAPVKAATVAPVATSTDENLADDTELVAVIMAAISAFEGTASTDGLVVRSIRRANRRN
jgi:sodium pump decarboxylase gamma subunit